MSISVHQIGLLVLFIFDIIWFSKVPCGHNTLQKIVPELMKAAGISGYYTNHSLRASAATRLFESGVDGQLIMSRTGHSSREGLEHTSEPPLS